MKKIYLSGIKGAGKFALVDDEDYDNLIRYSWFLTCKGYAARTRHGKILGETDKTVFMHREILNTPKGLFTDHINRDKLDNRKENLRVVDNRQNQLNKNLQRNNKSGYHGISWHENRTWWVRVYINKKAISLGCYKNLNDAILARKQGELLYYKT